MICLVSVYLIMITKKCNTVCCLDLETIETVNFDFFKFQETRMGFLNCFCPYPLPFQLILLTHYFIARAAFF